jgi:AAA15 family ATPase/GTPase
MPLNLFLPQRQQYFYFDGGGSKEYKMKNKLTVENFRVFKDTTEFELAPITILTGQNNSGKSSLLKALLVLSDFLDSGDQTYLDFNGRLSPRHRLSKFSNAKTNGSTNNTFSIKREINDLEVEYVFGGEDEDTNALLQLFKVTNTINNEVLTLERLALISFELTVTEAFINSIISPTSREQTIVDHSSLETELETLSNELSSLELQRNEVEGAEAKQRVELGFTIRRLKQRIKLIKNTLKQRKGIQSKIYNAVYNLEEPGRFNNIGNIIYSALTKEVGPEEFSEQDSPSFHRFIDRLMRFIRFGTEHLGPNRAVQARIFPRFTDHNELSRVINDFAILHPPIGGVARTFLSKWLTNFGIGDDIEIKSIEGEASSLIILNNNKPINLVDLGFGAGQLITILIKIANLIFEVAESRSYNRQYATSRYRNLTLLIEEPEANLHPRLQSLLAEMFYDVWKSYKINFILETHSEYLIRKLQVMVAKQEIDPQVGMIYYLDHNDDHTDIKKIVFKDDGYLSSEFGEGFFDESDKHALEIYRINKIKSLKNG